MTQYNYAVYSVQFPELYGVCHKNSEIRAMIYFHQRSICI